jgi:DNA repair protein RecN (Recombination protein N)
MLTRLHIRNIVLIAETEIAFTGGLNVLTGETGAGKSILLDALGLVLGDRADAGLVRHGETSGEVTAEFHLRATHELKLWLEDFGIPLEEDSLLLRRTIEANGRSRAFVNDTAVTVATLKALGRQLVKQHSQHDQRLLLDISAHRDALDLFAHANRERAAVAGTWHALAAARAELEALRARAEQASRERDYLAHMAGEIRKLHPETGEESLLADMRQQMLTRGKAVEALATTLATLQKPDMLAALRSAEKTFARTQTGETERSKTIHEALLRAYEDISTATDELERLLQDVPDEHALERAEERLFALRALARKYHTDVDGLVTELARAEASLREVENLDAETRRLQKACDTARDAYLEAAAALTAKREVAATGFARAIKKELAPLKMEKAQLAATLTKLPETGWGEAGVERVVFEASTNPGTPLKPLAEVASGGELSRLMLALKVVLPADETQNVYIFDEIDTGTGGAVADAIGARLKKLSQGGQVIVVTHAPQVAAQGDHHLHIQKRTARGATITEVTQLAADIRTDELARMLSGAEVTDEARSAAKRLLAAAG